MLRRVRNIFLGIGVEIGYASVILLGGFLLASLVVALL